MPCRLWAMFVPIVAPSLTPYALRCESEVEPLGIARSRPEFSWKLRAARPELRNLRQSAYRVRVGTRSGGSDAWDSGRVVSGAQYGVAFGGAPLPSGAVRWWSVMTWDGRGVPSAWSAPAQFSVGLLKERDWRARWIGDARASDARRATSRFADASWIWSAGTPEPGEVRTFVRDFDLPSGRIASATLRLTADDQFEAYVNGVKVAASDGATDAWRRDVAVDVVRRLHSGSNVVRIVARNVEGANAGVLARLEVALANGRKTTVVTDGTWRTDALAAARVVAPYGSAPWGRFADEKVLPPATVFRRGFTVRPALVRATAHVTALGLVDLHLNGRRVSEDRFTPGWTDYRKRVYARTFDVTGQMRAGENLAALEVGDGWYSGYVGYSRAAGALRRPAEAYGRRSSWSTPTVPSRWSEPMTRPGPCRTTARYGRPRIFSPERSSFAYVSENAPVR